MPSCYAVGAAKALIQAALRAHFSRGNDEAMAVFRVEKSRGYTVMSNHHLRNKELSLKANKKKLTWWQDEFWDHMVKKFPDLERGESASLTGRDHISSRVLKEMTRLTKQKAKLENLLTGINPFNAKSRAEEICKILDTYLPSVEKMDTLLRKYGVAFTKTASENKKLKTKNAELEESLASAQKVSTLKQIEDLKLRRDYNSAVAILEQIPPEVLELYKHPHKKERETAYDR